MKVLAELHRNSAGGASRRSFVVLTGAGDLQGECGISWWRDWCLRVNQHVCTPDPAPVLDSPLNLKRSQAPNRAGINSLNND